MLRQAVCSLKPTARLTTTYRAFSQSSKILEFAARESRQATSFRSNGERPHDEDGFSTSNGRGGGGGLRRKNTYKDARVTRSVIRTASSEPSDSSRFSECLGEVFAPLQFPDEIARRVLTHSSHPRAVDGHNGRFSFIGRRVLDAYLHMFLQSSAALTPAHELELIAQRVLASPVLGVHVASQWGLGKILRWTPAVKMRQARVESLQSVGMYKVHGEAVQAVIGAVFHQFGGVVAHRLFHTRVLPHVLLPGQSTGLPDVFHEEATRLCEAMGGPEGPLLAHPPTSASTSSSSTANAIPRESAQEEKVLMRN